MPRTPRRKDKLSPTHVYATERVLRSHTASPAKKKHVDALQVDNQKEADAFHLDSSSDAREILSDEESYPFGA